MTLHEELEHKIAAFKGTPACLVFNSGYHANIGVIASLMSEGDQIFSDSLNHASLIDGCRLSKAKTYIYEHNNLHELEKLLKNYHSGNKLIIVDSVFSMDGDIAPLPELLKLCETYDATLLIDEAHATGVFGSTGSGLIDHYGLNPDNERLIIMGTLGKALGSFGAYVCGSKTVIDWLINKSRAFIYTTSLPPAVLAASIEAINCVLNMPELRHNLWNNIKYFNDEIKKQAPKVKVPLIQSPIIPIILETDSLALNAAKYLFDKGFWLTAIRPPTVPEGAARLRLTLMSTHSQKQISELISCLKELI